MNDSDQIRLLNSMYRYCG